MSMRTAHTTPLHVSGTAHRGWARALLCCVLFMQLLVPLKALAGMYAPKVFSVELSLCLPGSPHAGKSLTLSAAELFPEQSKPIQSQLQADGQCHHPCCSALEHAAPEPSRLAVHVLNPQLAHHLAPAFLFAPHTLHAWSHAQSRAPPAQS